MVHKMFEIRCVNVLVDRERLHSNVHYFDGNVLVMKPDTEPYYVWSIHLVGKIINIFEKPDKVYCQSILDSVMDVNVLLLLAMGHLWIHFEFF